MQDGMSQGGHCRGARGAAGADVGVVGRVGTRKFACRRVAGCDGANDILVENREFHFSWKVARSRGKKVSERGNGYRMERGWEE